MVKICKNCNKEFEHINNTRGVFCSKHCYWEYRKTPQSEYRKVKYVTLICATCGKHFERREQEQKRKENKRAFCSLVCSGIGTKTREKAKKGKSVTLICKGCNNEFSVKASLANRRLYCSKQCHNNHKKLSLLGENNPNYKHGTNQGAAKNVAKLFYRQQCILCGFDVVVEVHHIIPKSNGGTNDAYNLAILCPNHHAMAGRNLISPDELFKAAQNALLPPASPTLDERHNSRNTSSPVPSQG